MAGLDLPRDVVREAADYPKRAWQALQSERFVQRHYSSRFDGCDRPLASVTLKVPTGGGKTLLAAHGIGAIQSRFLSRNTGLVLWVVPNEAIYAQTRRTLTDRAHPYRQALDRAGAGRVRVFDKDSPITALDLQANLCVMVLMLQSANRETKETLRMFRERGNVLGFVPPEGDAEAHIELKRRVPNLDVYDADLSHGAAFAIVKESLGNAVRIARPIIVLDEGHRGYSDLARRTLYGFNPSFVLELTATPREAVGVHPNVLSEVRGTDLDAAEMIKMPLRLTVNPEGDWHECLRTAMERRNELETTAQVFQANTGRYIRPILLVQVQLTGKEVRDHRRVHADDVVEYLKGLGIEPGWIAKKTADTNELKGEELLSERNQIRVIVTKQALQEGWDCPFAYVLCTLSASQSLGAMTQMVGRILRQPNAERTDVADLDRSYVYCNQVETGKVIDTIRRSLEGDGMGDLVGKVFIDTGGGGSAQTVVRKRRPQFATDPIYLPRVLWRDGDTFRELVWESDIQPFIDWQDLNVEPLVERLVSGFGERMVYTRELGISDLLGVLTSKDVITESSDEPFDPVYATRVLTDVVPNPWIARSILSNIVATLRQRNWSDKRLASASGHFLAECLRWLSDRRDEMAEAHFKRALADGRIVFELQATDLDWEMPYQENIEVRSGDRQIQGPSGNPVQRSLFEPEFETSMNDLELKLAVELDSRKVVDWWYRSIVKPSGYFLCGWRKQRIYPDFIASIASGKAMDRLVIETKGMHLLGNEDTEYKRRLFEALTSASQEVQTIRLGELGLEVKTAKIILTLLSENSWQAEIDAHFGQAGTARLS
jgi:type III restriction enzyme